ncbi:MAG: hypothetical protein HYW78_00790 [Parcubacteria group bacterium]|nr:hypothetical protein [Parcubacteria group bacterium]
METKIDPPIADHDINIIEIFSILKKHGKTIIITALIVIFLMIALSFFSASDSINDNKLLEGSLLLDSASIDNGENLKIFLEHPSTLQILAQRLDIPIAQAPQLKQKINIKPQKGKFLEITVQDYDSITIKKFLKEISLIINEQYRQSSRDIQLRIEAIENLAIQIKQAQEQIIEFAKDLSRLKYGQSEGEGLIAQSYIQLLNGERKNLLSLQQEKIKNEKELAVLKKTDIIGLSSEPIQANLLSGENNKEKQKFLFIIAVLVGLFVGLIIAFFKEYLDRAQKKHYSRID